MDTNKIPIDSNKIQEDYALRLRIHRYPYKMYLQLFIYFFAFAFVRFVQDESLSII